MRTQTGRDRVIEELEKPFPILNICDVMDWIYDTFEADYFSQSWEWECEKVKQFCENFNVMLYEQPRESFFEWEGIEQAKKGGYKGVILSDLS
jgi:hypothetical protein